MPYAADNTLSQSPISGGVEISDAEYQAGVQAQLVGKRIAIRDGALRILESTTRTVYSTADKSALEVAENDDTPSGYTEIEPGEFDEWDGIQWVENTAASLEAAKTARRELIDQARIVATDSGFDHDFGGTVDRVQTRPEDRENLLGLESEAHNLKADGETGAVIPFRAESNAEYNLTPDEMIAISRAALAHKQAQYQAAWDLKAQISAASTIAGVDAIAWP